MARQTPTIQRKRDLYPAASAAVPGVPTVTTETGAGNFSVTWTDPTNTRADATFDLEYTVNGGAPVLVTGYTKATVVDSGAAGGAIVARVRQNIPTTLGAWGPTGSGTAGTA